MPTFRPPDIDPTLTQEAQQVVDQVSAKMESWLKEAFSKLEVEFDKDLADIESKLNAEKLAFLEEEQRQARQLIGQLQQLKTAGNQLTPLDPDQEIVIKKISQLVEQAEADMETRNKRWSNFGGRAVSIVHTGLKTLLKGVI